MNDTPSIMNEEFEDYMEKYGERYKRALKSVEEGMVKKYIIKDGGQVRWIVVGKNRDYIIVDNNYCSCYDFYHRVLQLQETDKCYHLIAKMIAEKNQKYDKYEITFQEFLNFLKEWL